MQEEMVVLLLVYNLQLLLFVFMSKNLKFYILSMTYLTAVLIISVLKCRLKLNASYFMSLIHRNVLYIDHTCA
uniref:Uncharacterized protein n=1 Tax=Anguilla anguilla TaxID=7936 RepID=A0A0E9XSB6_ANGAN